MANIIQGELVGKRAEVTDSTNPHDRGITGTIVDETKSTLTIRMSGSPKKLLKKNITLRIGAYIIKGSALLKRPEERIKIKVKQA